MGLLKTKFDIIESIFVEWNARVILHKLKYVHCNNCGQFVNLIRLNKIIKQAHTEESFKNLKYFHIHIVIEMIS